MKAVVAIETITPKQASEMLGNQVGNQRKLGDRHVSMLAKEMAEGRFMLSCDALVLIKGQLGNGQHRLEAVVRTKKAQQFLVLKTDDDALFDIIDCGKGRKINDVLFGDGISNANRISSIARQTLLYDYKAILGTGTQYPHLDLENIVTRTDVLEYVRANLDEISGIVEFVAPLYRAGSKLITITLTGTLIHIASRKKANSEKVREFVTHVYNGDTGLDCPARQTRERFIKNASSKSKLNKQYLFALLIKAYNAFLDGSKLGVIKLAENEDYPMIKN